MIYLEALPPLVNVRGGQRLHRRGVYRGDNQGIPFPDLERDLFQGLQVCRVGWPDQGLDIRGGRGHKRGRRLQSLFPTAHEQCTGGSSFPEGKAGLSTYAGAPYCGWNWSAKLRLLAESR